MGDFTVINFSREDIATIISVVLVVALCIEWFRKMA